MIISEKLVKEKLLKRPLDANKGTFGKALIIAGSQNYPGAAILSVLACARTGTGLGTLATTPEVYKVVVPKIPFATFLEFSEIIKNIEKYDAILLGPGLGQSFEAKQLVTEIINSDILKSKKVVIDADALNILSKTADWHKTLNTDLILTPHPGEMSRLTNLSIDEIQKNREQISLKFSKLWNKTIILKGARTVISNAEGNVYTSDVANPLLATAGTGDILAGILTGFLAQGLNLIDAGVAAVYLHAKAADKLKEKFGDRGATSLDLVDMIPEVFKDLTRPNS